LAAAYDLTKHYRENTTSLLVEKYYPLCQWPLLLLLLLSLRLKF